MKGLTAFFRDHPGVEVFIFAGKGGLGKTTCSSAVAHYLATREQRRTLLFSTDPQASLSDIFERDFYGKGVTEILPNLSIVEIDADRRVADYQAEIKRKIKEMYGLDEIPPEIDEYIDSTSAEPAMYESATYDAMAELVAMREYERYIFDMPPFGHGVRMVAMAEILSKWVDKITEAREKVREYEEVAATLKGEAVGQDEVMNELIGIRNKIRTFTDLITDVKRTAFFMVLIPEQMAILDTERALTMFEDLGIRMSGLIVNQIYPPNLLHRPEVSEFLKSRITMQQRYMETIREKFGPHLVGALHMYPREPKGLAMIAKVAEDLMRPDSLPE
jgi:arsenite-transporting ATPase